MTNRTVLDVAQCGECSCSAALACLGIDPDMPFEKFKGALSVGLTVIETPERAAAMTDEQRAALEEEAERIDRWLRWGQRVEEMEASGMPDEAIMPVVRGWDACLAHIKEEP